MAGIFLAAGFLLVLWSLKSDPDHLAKACGLAHYGSNRPCCLCPCEDGARADPSMLFSNFSNLAQWMHMLVTHTQWKALNPDPHSVFQLLWMSAVNIDPDEDLHVLPGVCLVDVMLSGDEWSPTREHA